MEGGYMEYGGREGSYKEHGGREGGRVRGMLATRVKV